MVKTVRTVTRDWTSELKGMAINSVLEFPINRYSTINSLISRLRLEMCVEGANWKREGEIDKKNGFFKIKRIS